MGYTPPLAPTLSPQPPPPRVDKNDLQLTKIKPGNEQRDYATANYSVALE